MDAGVKTDYGFVRVCAVTPRVFLGECAKNVWEMLFLAGDARDRDAHLALFPELCITGYTCGELFFDQHLRDSAVDALTEFIAHMPEDIVCIVGLPLVVGDALYNVAAVCLDGEVVAFVPKTHPPNYREFYEGRYFASAKNLPRGATVRFDDDDVPIGTDVLIDLVDKGRLSSKKPFATLGIEICEDVWAPTQPSTEQALAGAQILLNLSASNALVGKSAYRRNLVRTQSERCIAAYIYASCGPGESTSGVVFDGHAMIAENGSMLAESRRFDPDQQIIIADVDVERLIHERLMNTTFRDSQRGVSTAFRRVACAVSRLRFDGPNELVAKLYRSVDPTPHIPSDPRTRDERCEEIYNIQVTALAHRLTVACSTAHEVAIGISGGLDSTWAWLVLLGAYKRLGWDRAGLKPVTMPGPGTGVRTKGNAYRLVEPFGVTLAEVPIEPIAAAYIRNTGHDPCWNCLTCENAQARARTGQLMTFGFMLGTGDLSELALGWCTYAGDHISMYNPNAGLLKTLLKFLVQWAADKDLFPEISATLRDIVATPISPELTRAATGELQQQTESIVGPYILHDFFLTQIVRYGFAPRKTFFLARHAFARVTNPETGALFAPHEIQKWLVVFLRRFHASQFKRAVATEGPKIGSISFDPRGDWRMPSDISMESWVKEAEGLDPLDP